MIQRIDREKLGTMEVDQDLVVAGYVGEQGAALIAKARRKELRQWFSDQYIDTIEAHAGAEGTLSWEKAKDLGATEFERIGEGGIFTALWNLSGCYRQGITIYLRDIPVRQSTIELCERYELMPYRLWSGNCAVLVAKNGRKLVKTLAAEGIDAAIIGQVRAGVRKEICQGTKAGCMERPKPDEIYKVLPDFDPNNIETI